MRKMSVAKAVTQILKEVRVVREGIVTLRISVVMAAMAAMPKRRQEREVKEIRVGEMMEKCLVSQAAMAEMAAMAALKGKVVLGERVIHRVRMENPERIFVCSPRKTTQAQRPRLPIQDLPPRLLRNLQRKSVPSHTTESIFRSANLLLRGRGIAEIIIMQPKVLRPQPMEHPFPIPDRRAVTVRLLQRRF